MSILRIFLSILLLAVISGCQTFKTNNLYDPTLPISEAPKNLSGLSNSIYLIIFADRPQTQDLSDDGKIQTFMKNLGPLSKSSQQIIHSQIQMCSVQKIMNKCKVSLDNGTFTGFVMKDRRHIYSSYHPFFEYMKNVVALNAKDDPPQVTGDKVTKTPLPIFIFNNSGEMVFDPSRGNVFINNISWYALYAETKDKILVDYDFVELAITSEIADAIPLEPAEVKDHEKIYLAGFPSEVIDKNSPSGSSPRSNISLHLSAGEYLPYVDAAKKLNLTPIAEMSKEMKSSALEAKLYVDDPSLGGMSGGPYVNADGKVVGIHHGIRSTGERDPLSIGIKSKFALSFPYGIKR